MNEVLNRVKKYMESLPVQLDIIEFEEGTTHTAEMAAGQLGVEVGQIAKTMLFMGGEQPILVVTSGDVKVSSSKLKKKIGSKPKMASAQDCEEITGFKPGGICPFALPNKMDIFIDKSLERYDVVYAAAGTANTAVPVTVDQLLEVTGGQLADIC